MKMTLTEIADKADAYAEHLRDADSLRFALRNLAMLVREHAAPAHPAESEGWLSRRMKSPAFRAAYERISAEEQAAAESESGGARCACGAVPVRLLGDPLGARHSLTDCVGVPPRSPPASPSETGP